MYSWSTTIVTSEKPWGNIEITASKIRGDHKLNIKVKGIIRQKHVEQQEMLNDEEWTLPGSDEYYAFSTMTPMIRKTSFLYPYIMVNCTLDRTNICVRFSFMLKISISESNDSYEITLVSLENTMYNLVHLNEKLNKLEQELQRAPVPRIQSLTNLCDFHIKSHSKVFPVHACVLAAQWPFFCKMLESDMKESQLRELNIDFDDESVNHLIDFFYGTLTLDNQIGLGKLARLGAHYDVPDLQVFICRKLITMKLKAEQFASTWNIVVEANRKEFRDKWIQLFVENQDLIVQSEDFECLSQPALLTLVQELVKLNRNIINDNK